MSGQLINPADFPMRSADLDTNAMRASATTLSGLGATVVARTDTISRSWSGLAASYQAPESDQVLGLMGPVATKAGEVDDVYGQVAARLHTYADELDVIKPRLADLERRATAFRDKVKNGVKTSLVGEVDLHWYSSSLTYMAWGAAKLTDGWRTVPWYEHDPSLEKNNRLWREFGDLLEQVTASASTCANDINRIAFPLQCMTPYEAIPAEAFMAGAVPAWGGPRASQRNCVEQVTSGTDDFIKGVGHGVGGLTLGYDPQSGDFFTRQGWGQSWGGLGNLVYSAAFLSTAGVAYTAADARGIEFGDTIDAHMLERATVLRDAGASLISYDPYAADGDGWHLWKGEGWNAGTQTALNAATFFIPGAGAVGAGIKSTKAATAVRVTATAADALVDGGSWLVKGSVNAGKGLSALARGQGRTAVVDATRATAGGGARVTGRGGLTANGLQALDELDNVNPPRVEVPADMPRVTDTLLDTPTRPTNTGPGADVPGITLTDDAIREATDSWVNQDAPTDVADLPARAPEPELVGVGARPGHVTNSVDTLTPGGATTTTGGHIDAPGSPHTVEGSPGVIRGGDASGGTSGGSSGDGGASANHGQPQSGSGDDDAGSKNTSAEEGTRADEKEPGEEVGDAHDAHPNRPEGVRDPGDPASFGTSSSDNYRIAWRDAHPEYSDRDVWVHHAVERQVQRLYPGLISDSQLHSLDNLRGIPKSVNREVHLQKIRVLWNQFYTYMASLRRNPTQQELLDWATMIDNNLGHYFLPPER